MKEKILDKSAEMFLHLGFKSVTLDDIANSIGISKKTIYQHFSNKNELVEACVFHLFDRITCSLESIKEESENPIEELFRIKWVIRQQLKNEANSPYFQLKKYYPKTFKCFRNRQKGYMLECVVENITKGIEMGLFRKELDVDFTGRMYFAGMISTKDEEVFPLDIYPKDHLADLFLDYHLRAIVTPKGLETLDQFNNIDKQKKQ
ncbi:TetR/AcrR family transcriptional regulator [Robertkochia solimangrovi]|uniref:TetR/AcrR family transcriptional regulator n=1 Tax=Robertkochia solimangrovi TaxID=2213046 RepID=UPI00117EFE17|nr:TetR/AcrR family transcriptional regulator [Robertkochia solimangrovi]TRZ46263.1 TetR/AcrR family transcriptional regulator [Robertkochia solimangrovi]